MKKLYYFLFISLLVISGCKKDKDDDNNNIEFQKVSNNQSILTGSQIGTGTAANNQLYKSVAVNLNQSSDLFEIGNAMASMSTPTSSYVYYVIPVTNKSTLGYAYININGIKYSDNDGNNIPYESLDFDYVEATMGVEIDDAVNPSYTNTYLDPGETGYFMGIEQLPFDDLKSIEIDYADYSEGYGVSPHEFIALSYESSNDMITVSVKNNSSIELYFDDARYMHFNESGSPYYWSFLDPSSALNLANNLIGADQTALLEDNINYAGNTNKILVNIEYEINNLKKGIISSDQAIHGPYTDKDIKHIKVKRNLKLRELHQSR